MMLKKMRLLQWAIALVLSTSYLYAQKDVTLTGVVTEKQTGKALPGVNVLLKGHQRGGITNAQGHFEIKNVKEGSYTLTASFIGYENQEKEIAAKAGLPSINFELVKSTTEIQDVEVKGTYTHRTEEALKIVAPLSDIPITTSTTDRELLDQKQFSSLNDALNYTTGISATLNYGGFQTFNMRGFRAPVIMVDGARDERMNFSNSAPVTSLAAVDHIEYLKGPSSVLYGHSAVGGILNIIRKQPTSSFKANMEATYGSWKTKQVTFGAGGPLAEKLNYRLDVGLSDRVGWRENNDKYANAYLALDYLIDDNNKIEFRFGGNDDFYGTETGLPVVQYDIYDQDGALAYKQGELPSNFDREERYNEPSDFLKHQNLNGSVKYKHTFSRDAYVQVHASYSKDIIDYFSTEELSYLTSSSAVYDHYYLDGEDTTYICLDTLQRTYPFRFSHRTSTYQNYLDFFKRFTTGSIEHKLLAGYYFMYVDRTSYSGYNLGEDVTGDGLYAKVSVVDPVVNQGDVQTRFSAAKIYHEMINGLYVQDFLHISDKLKALLGLRYDYYHMNYQTANVESGLSLTDRSDKSTLTSSSLTYRAGIVYQPISPLSLYASYSTFFKPNRKVYSSDYIYIDSDGDEFFPDEGEEFFKPLTGYQVEGGFKYTLNHLLQINSSVFYIVQNNIIEYLGLSDEDKRIYGQVGVIDSKGFDVEAVTSPLEGLKIIAGYGCTIAKYAEFSTNKYAENSDEGNYVKQYPKDKFYSWLYYKVPKGKLKKLNAGVGFNFTGKVYTESSNTYELPEYGLVDASLGYSIKNTSIKFGVFNVLDKEYYSNYVYSTQFVPGCARNYKLTVGIKL